MGAVDRSCPNRHIRSPTTTGPRSIVRSAPAWPRSSFGMRVSRRGRLRRIQRTRLQINRKAWWGRSQSRDAAARRRHGGHLTIPEQTRHIHTEHGHLPLRPTRDNSAGVDQLSTVLSGIRQLRTRRPPSPGSPANHRHRLTLRIPPAQARAVSVRRCRNADRSSGSGSTRGPHRAPPVRRASC
jgi:hypothetical protein